ncbi:MAG: hypothetical protein K0M40_19720 [Prolixibacteraceae bacterium]|nr:hypothetical protein [Prolixibacteraceae bacterium]
MMHTVLTCLNIIFAFAFIIFLGFLYTQIKNESGKWTALLVLLIGLAFININSPDSNIDNHKKEFILYDCPSIKSNRNLEIESKFGSLITIHHILDIYVPQDKSDSIISIVGQNSYVTGLTSGFKFEVSNIKLEQTNDNKIKYRVRIKSSIRLFGLWNYSEFQTLVGEK